jgi:hypothetical protein
MDVSDGFCQDCGLPIRFDLREAIEANCCDCVVAEFDRLTAELAEAKKENAALREYVEIVTDGGTDYPESWDELQRLGIIVEVKPTPEFIDEWGDDCPMWVLAWKAGEFEAIDAAVDALIAEREVTP